MKKTFYLLCLIFLLTTSLVAISPDYTVKSIHFYSPDAQTVAQITLRPYQNTSGLDDIVVEDKEGRFANYLLQSITTQNPQLKESASIKLLQSYAKERCVWAGVVGEAIFSTLNLDLQCPTQKKIKHSKEKAKKGNVLYLLLTTLNRSAVRQRCSNFCNMRTGHFLKPPPGQKSQNEPHNNASQRFAAWANGQD